MLALKKNWKCAQWHKALFALSKMWFLMLYFQWIFRDVIFFHFDINKGMVFQTDFQFFYGETSKEE